MDAAEIWLYLPGKLILAESTFAYLVSAGTGIAGIAAGWLLHRRKMLGLKPVAWAKCSPHKPGEIAVDIIIENRGNLPLYIIKIHAKEILMAETMPFSIIGDGAEREEPRYPNKWKHEIRRDMTVEPGKTEIMYVVVKTDARAETLRAHLDREKGNPAPNAYRVTLYRV